ncbi:MAG: sulfatase [Myxococcales bacterium]|nr:sulfatase [Myxococcales bacterium]
MRAVLLLCAALWLGGCASERRPNLVLVVVDTLRADALAFSGGRFATPHADAIAAEGVWFTRAYANSSWTLPSMASLLLSQVGSHHGVVGFGSVLPEAAITLTEALRDHGYATAGFAANVLIEAGTGFEQGFDHFDVPVDLAGWGKTKLELFPNAPAGVITGLAVDWLASQPLDRPFFLYVHYMEPHTPYRCSNGKQPCRDGAAALSEALVNERWNFTDAEARLIRRLYGLEVTVFDVALGSLVAALRERDALENTWIVITADHGELLGEGGRYLHGDSLEIPEIRIPLVIRGPKRQSGRVDTPVSLIDVAPTLLEIAAVPRPAGFRGRSLLPALRGGAIDAVPVVSELFLRGEKTPRHRLVVVDAAGSTVLASDGAVTRRGLDPDAKATPAARSDLVTALGERLEWIDFEGPDPSEAPPLSEAMRERLRALGYAR